MRVTSKAPWSRRKVTHLSVPHGDVRRRQRANRFRAVRGKGSQQAGTLLPRCCVPAKVTTHCKLGDTSTPHSTLVTFIRDLHIQLPTSHALSPTPWSQRLLGCATHPHTFFSSTHNSSLVHLSLTPNSLPASSGARSNTGNSAARMSAPAQAHTGPTYASVAKEASNSDFEQHAEANQGSNGSDGATGLRKRDRATVQSVPLGAALAGAVQKQRVSEAVRAKAAAAFVRACCFGWTVLLLHRHLVQGYQLEGGGAHLHADPTQGTQAPEEIPC